MVITWQQFISLAANRKLSLKEQKKKFLQENAEQLRHLEYIQAMYGAGGAAGSGGIVLDGPIEGATVVSNVGSAVTDATGKFTLPGIPEGTITVTGGTDTITGLPYEGELIGDAQYKTISPITTFAHYLKQASIENEKTPTLTFDEAITKTFTDSFDYFGISLPIEDKDIILQKDYIGDAIVNNNKIGISAQAVATQIEAIAETVGVALAGSSEAADFAKEGKGIPEFSERNRKQTAYKALGRQANNATTLRADEVSRQVRYVNPVKGGINSGVIFTNSKILAEQLETTKQELITISNQEQYTNNYLTTQIQAVNRAQKTVIKNEVKTTVETRDAAFTNVKTAANSDAVKDALKRIEKDKANEKTPQLDGTEFSIPSGQSLNTTYKQVRKDAKTGEKTLTTLKLGDKSIAYFYFGSAKDTPQLLAKARDNSYSLQTLSATTDESIATAIVPNIPVTVEVTTRTLEADTIKTYTLLPTLASSRLADEKFVTLRLTRLTETVTQKVVPHITQDKTLTYGATYTPDGGEKIVQSISLDNEELDGRFEISRLLMGDPAASKSAGRFELKRYLIVDGAESPLLKLTHTANASLSVEKLAFRDRILSIAVPATEGTGEEVSIPKGTLEISFTISDGPR
jgi:hypothetical protein